MEECYEFFGCTKTECIIQKNKKVYAGFCCTHYGYSSDIFEKVLIEKFGKNVVNFHTNMPKIKLKFLKMTGFWILMIKTCTILRQNTGK